MTDRLYEDSPEVRLAICHRAQRKVRNDMMFLLGALVAGWIVLTAGILWSPTKGASELALYAVAVILWAAFLSRSLLQVYKWGRNMAKPTIVDSSNLQLTGVEEVIPLEAIEKVFWNPRLPYFVIERRQSGPARFSIVRKEHIGSPEAFAAALRTKLNVVDSPIMDQDQIAEERRRPRSDGRAAE